MWLIKTLSYKMRQMLLQNATAILLQNASGFLLQNATVLLENATVITKCDVYYKLRQSSAHQFADASLFVHLAVNSIIKYHYH